MYKAPPLFPRNVEKIRGSLGTRLVCTLEIHSQNIYIFTGYKKLVLHDEFETGEKVWHVL